MSVFFVCVFEANLLCARDDLILKCGSGYIWFNLFETTQIILLEPGMTEHLLRCWPKGCVL